MTIHELIRTAYPGADPTRDYVVQDDGAGPYLAAWRLAGPIPEGVPTVAETPLQRWYRLSAALCATATTQIIDATAAPQRIRATGGIDAQIAAAEPEAEVAPGVTREMAEEMAALWDWFQGAAQTPLTDERAHGKAPISILSELGGA
jgi:hypothetical protein